MKSFLKITTLLLAFIVTISSCKKEKNESPSNPVDSTKSSSYGSLKITIDHFAGDSTFELKKEYLNAHKDTFSVTMLQYFISNIKLSNWNEDTIFSLPKSYHLIKAGNGSIVLQFDSIPVKKYNKFMYSIGVDSLANHSTDHASGDLQPSGADGMIWNWNTGYKFMKFEGKYKTDTTNKGEFVFHVGKDANYRKLTETGHHAERSTKIQHFGLLIEKDKITNLHFEVDVLALMGSAHIINLDVMNAVHGDNATLIADNYATKFISIHKE